MVSKVQAILSFLKEKAPLTVTPLEISRATKINHSTVKVYLRKMIARGIIHRPIYGHYVLPNDIPVNIPNDVVGGDSVARYAGLGYHGRWHGRGVHNLILAVDMPDDCGVGGEDVFVFEGGVKIRIQYGRKRRKITVHVSCGGSTPIEVQSFPFIISLIKAKLLLKTGYEFGDLGFRVVSFELHEDFETVRMEGIKCVTLKSFTGFLERVYNKGGGLRSEVKGRTESLGTIYAALKGGVSTYNVLQFQHMTLQRLEALVQVIKFQNENMHKIFNVIHDFLNKQSSSNPK